MAYVSINHEDRVWVLTCLREFEDYFNGLEYKTPTDRAFDSMRLRASGYENFSVILTVTIFFLLDLIYTKKGICCVDLDS